MRESTNALPVRIFAVIVLYKTLPAESASFQTLLAAMKSVQVDRATIKIFFYDNTPGGQDPGCFPESIPFESHGENRGLAVAYNRALEIAVAEKYDWLLTLDQDTSLPVDFLHKIGCVAEFVAPIEQVAAIVPRIYDKQKLISPNALSYEIFPTFFPEDFIGVSLEPSTSAINSASTVRVSALKAIGGYDLRFPLDYCDAVMYHRLHANKLRVFIAGNIRVEHELSVLDMKHRVTPERYEGILGAESAFWDECMGRVADISLFLRYMYRGLYKFWRTGGDLSFVKITLRFLWRRLFYSRKQRMDAWQKSVKVHFVSSE